MSLISESGCASSSKIFRPGRGGTAGNLSGRLVLADSPRSCGVGELLVVSFAIQLVFVVLMVIFFHRVSLIAPFLNLLAVPLVGVLVPLGFPAAIAFFGRSPN